MLGFRVLALLEVLALPDKHFVALLLIVQALFGVGIFPYTEEEQGVFCQVFIVKYGRGLLEVGEGEEPWLVLEFLVHLFSVVLHLGDDRRFFDLLPCMVQLYTRIREEERLVRQ